LIAISATAATTAPALAARSVFAAWHSIDARFVSVVVCAFAHDIFGGGHDDITALDGGNAV